MLRRVLLCSMLVLLAAPASAYRRLSEDLELPSHDLDTEGFALVLGGGGARGLAHIGVLRVLEELEMRPSLIVGTSMGAIMGALYASGNDAQVLEDMAVNREWLQLFLDTESAAADVQGGWFGLPKHQLTLKLDRMPPLPRAGASYGQSIETLLGRLCADALFVAENDFDRLPIPFRCVTTDLLSSELNVHHRGPLPRLAKASGTIPIIFQPVEYRGRYLVDGGFMDNLPLQVARRLGFRRALVVDVSNIFLPNKKLPGDLPELTVRVMELGQITQNDAELGENDVLLRVDLQEFRSLSFWGAPEIIEAGYATAQAQRDELLALKEACGPSAHGARLVRPEMGPIEIAAVSVAGSQRMSGWRVRRRMGLRAGDRLELEAVWNLADRLAREGSFDNVWLEVTPRDAGTAEFVVHVVEQRDPVLEVGGHVITDDGPAVFGRLRADNIMGLGGSRALSYRYGDELTAFDARAGQSIVGPGTVEAVARAVWARERPELYERGKPLDDMVLRRFGLGLDVAARLREAGLTLFLGASAEESRWYPLSRAFAGSGPVQTRAFHIGLESRVLGGLVADDRSGTRVDFTRALRELGGDVEFWRLELGSVTPGPRVGRWRPVFAGGFVRSSSDLPFSHQERAGGPEGWIGLRREEIIAPQILWGHLALEYYLHPELRVELAGAVGWSGTASLDESSPLWGGGAQFSLDTPLGPCRVGYALAEERKGFLFLQLGHDF